MPERASEQVKVTVTSLLCQPKALGGVESEATIVGGVLSRLIVTAADAEFPALSYAIPKMTWLLPSTETIAGSGHVAIPERLSEQVNVTVTSLLYHPAIFGNNEDKEIVIAGGILSTSI